MKTFLAFVALSAVIAAPAFAQTPYHEPASLQRWASRVHVYAPNHYARHEGQNGNTNPDFQMGSNED
jgi:hypothetical protein